MPIIHEKAGIISKKEIAQNIFDLTLLAPKIAEAARPGNFIHIRCEGLCLRRPISICDTDKEEGSIRVIFQVKGAGTKTISTQNEALDILGPLGNGFDVSDKTAKAVFVGGGIGIFPLLFALKQLPAPQKVFLGFQNEALVLLEQDFKEAGAELEIYTNDGSYGKAGFATSELEAYLKASHTDIVYSCGPTPMLKAVAKICEKCGTRCQVSLEEKMGCGVGACLVCACKVKSADGWEYEHVCKDGPVFDARTVIFDE